MRALNNRIAHCALALGLLAASAGCGSTPQGGSVTIMVPWSGDEFQAFYAVIKTFKKNHPDINVDVEVTRALTQQLDAAVKAGRPPDLAVLPSVGAVDEYATAAKLQRLAVDPKDIDPKNFVEPFSALMTVGDGVYAVPVKADVKSLIWYDPLFSAKPPTEPSALQALSKGHAWCLGLASGPTSGWPGADWIADLVLAQYGAPLYVDWLTGKASWSGAQVDAAWNTWGNLIRDSTGNALTTGFADAAKGMTNGPSCRLDHGALAAMGFPQQGLAQGENYDFASPPKATPLEVSADFVGMFAQHNPAATALIKYLASADTQTAWVKAGSYAFSADTMVTADKYPNFVEQRIAGLLQPHSGYTLCFSAADMMEPDLSAAFYQAVVDYVEGSALPPLLGTLDSIEEKSIEKNKTKNSDLSQVLSKTCSTLR